jgi:hypothetical protein
MPDLVSLIHMMQNISPFLGPPETEIKSGEFVDDSVDLKNWTVVPSDNFQKRLT